MLRIFLLTFLFLSVSRFLPHPPNFTNLIALSFYVPILFGAKFIPLVFLSFVLTDFFIGFHSTILFTWGSILIIGLISNKFTTNLKTRSLGIFYSLCIFFLISNFGVWISGQYTYTLSGLINCYYLAIPFFGNTLISTILYSFIIELLILKFYPKNRIYKLI